MKRFGVIISVLAILATGCSKNNETGSTSVVTVTTAGTLANLLGSSLKTSKKLIVSGTIDARDFVTIRDSMPSLTTLDLSAAKIVDYSGTLGTAGTKNIDYPANTVPTLAFHNATTNANKTALTKLSLPGSATAIGDSALMNCSGLTTFTMPYALVTLGSSAFFGCNGLTEITIPSTVTAIGSYAFFNCSGLTTITVYSSSPINLSRSISVFSGVNANTCILYVPSGMKSTYQAAIGWSYFTLIAELGGGVAT
jgi:hypothetical protein